MEIFFRLRKLKKVCEDLKIMQKELGQNRAKNMKALRKYRFEPEYAVAPGETLRETMESLDMSQRELAARTGLTVQTLNRIFRGEQPISYETANRLELATNVPARMWNNLEAEYREQLAKIKERERLQNDLEWLKIIPTKELLERDEIEPQEDKVFLLRETLSFYGVSSVEAWHELWDKPKVAARRSACFETRPGPASAWIRMGERQAQKRTCADFDKATFTDALETIRGLTAEEPQVFEPEMKRLCAGAGVALALVREMKKVPWNGATKWLSPRKAMVLLSLRGKGEDSFWFSFFHEAGHVLHDNKKDVLIADGSKTDPREVRADTFAAEFLIPAEHNDRIRNANTATALKRIARELGIAPGIVAGRYQFLTNRWNYHKDMIRTLQWNDEEY
jgi:HTH-type transcriptional regulator / antitoxin HigA